MNTSNPTQIRLGMAATIAGKKYHVVGRSVLGVTEGYKVYTWNEYNLEGSSGNALLVYEETEDGPEWRFFTLFEPQVAITANGAAAMREGDTVNFDGDNCHITQVDTSRVYFIQGKAWEGEKNGSTARYFNASVGRKMFVVSWTGDEVECYRGMTVPSGVVAAAFNLTKAALLKFKLSGGKSYLRTNTVFTFIILFSVLVFLAWTFKQATPVIQAPAVAKFTAPSSFLNVADVGVLDGKQYHVNGHSLVAVGEMGTNSQRHEYILAGDDGTDALLIHGLQPGTHDWILLTPSNPPESLTPKEAAKIAVGKVVNVDGVLAAVTDLTKTTVLSGEASGTEKPRIGDVRYGFLGRQNKTIVLVRWNETQIMFYRGKAVSEAEMTVAFGKTLVK